MKKCTSILLLLAIILVNMSGCTSRREREALEVIQFTEAFWYATFFSFDALLNDEVLHIQFAFHDNSQLPLQEQATRLVFVHSLEEAISLDDSERVMFAWPWERSYRGVAELNAIIALYNAHPHLQTIWRERIELIPDTSMFPIELENIVDNWEEVFAVMRELNAHRKRAVIDASVGMNGGMRITVCEEVEEGE